MIRTKRDPRSLRTYGPRLEIELGPPFLRTPEGILLPRPKDQARAHRFSRMPALLDTGAGKTIVTPEAVQSVGLQKIDTTRLARAGGVDDNAGVYAASIQFPRDRLATIEIIEVICCELPEQPIQCLLGRDVLARWLFTYNGPKSEWTIEEEDVAPWVEPPEGVDM